MTLLSYSQEYQGLGDIMMHRPERYLPLMRFIATVMNGESELSRVQREMIAVKVSNLNACAYCVGVHDGVIEQLELDVADEKMKPILAYVEKLTRNPARISQLDIDAITNAGWSQQTVADVIDVTGLFNLVNRMVDGIGVKGNETHFKEIGGFLAQSYDAVTQMLEQQTAGHE